METPTNTAAGTAPAIPPVPPAVAPAPTATPAAKPDTKSFMASLTSEQRMLAAQGKIDQIVLTPEQKALAAPSKPAETPAAAPAAPEAPAAAPEPTPAPAPTSAAGDAGDEGDSPAPGDDPAAQKGKRFRFSSEEDQAIAQIAKSKGISLLEAAKVYAGDSAPKAPATPEAAAVPAADPHVAEIDGKIAAAKERITTLLAERKKASDDLDNDKALSLSDEIADLKADVKLFENEKQGHLRNREQNARQGYESAVNQSRDRVLVAYPELAQPESMQRLALDAYIERAIKDPARAADFKDTSWPEKLTQEFATKHGLKPAGTAPAPTPTPTQPKPPTMPKAPPTQVLQPQGSRMLTGADGKSAAPSTLTKEQVLEKVRTDPEARRQAVRQFSSTPGRSR